MYSHLTILHCGTAPQASVWFAFAVRIPPSAGRVEIATAMKQSITAMAYV